MHSRRRELERAYQAASEGRVFSGQPLTVGSGKSARTVMLVSSPIMYDGHFLGMIGTVVISRYGFVAWSRSAGVA